jgi:hypothetical protein
MAIRVFFAHRECVRSALPFSTAVKLVKKIDFQRVTPGTDRAAPPERP